MRPHCPECGGFRLLCKFEPTITIDLDPDAQSIQVGELTEEYYSVECKDCGAGWEHSNVPGYMLQYAIQIYVEWMSTKKGDKQ